MEILDLKSKLGEEPKKFTKPNGFEIHHISEEPIHHIGSERKEKSPTPENQSSSLPTTHSPLGLAPSQTIEVDFSMFSELVSNPNSQKVIKEHPHAKIIINANLLTKLAANHDEKNNNKIQVIFLVGLIIGIAFTWVLINEF